MTKKRTKKKTTTRRRRNPKKRNGPVTDTALALVGLAALGGAGYYGYKHWKKGQEPESCTVTLKDANAAGYLNQMLVPEPPADKEEFRAHTEEYFKEAFPDCSKPARVKVEMTGQEPQDMSLQEFIDSSWDMTPGLGA